MNRLTRWDLLKTGAGVAAVVPLPPTEDPDVKKLVLRAMDASRAGWRLPHNMRHPSTLVSGALALVLAWTAPAAAGAQSATSPPPLVLDQVTVVDVEHGPLLPE